MDLVKKAAAAIKRSDNRGNDPSDTNLYTREVDKYGTILLDSAATAQAKIAAIKSLGFVGYLANPDVTRDLSTYMRPLLSVLKDDSLPKLQLEVARALSGICHRNRVMQDAVMEDEEAISALVRMMKNTTDFRAGRWATYSFVIMLSDNATFMRLMAAMPEVRSGLEAVASVQEPWTAWEMNYAELGLAMLGFWPATAKMLDSLDLPIHFYDDVSDSTDSDDS